jgi:tetratricopeptide (TPR) repeat protein
LVNPAPFRKFEQAGIAACFFLISFFGRAADKDWVFDADATRAHQLILNLQTDAANQLLARVKTNPLHVLYLSSLNETIDALISEDEEKFAQTEVRFKDRLTLLEKMGDTPDALFLRAELQLHKGFNHINLGQEVNAVLAIRTAYLLAQQCMRKYPEFLPVKKTSGVIQVMIGSIPDKFHWLVSLLGMKGSVVTGQRQLGELRNSRSSLHVEASILLYTIKGLINQQVDEASRGFQELLREQPGQRLLSFLAINMMIKNNQSEEALRLIHQLDAGHGGLSMHYLDYIRGEILLQKAEYPAAIQAYQRFMQHYRSANFKKDATYKISLAYFLQGKHETAKTWFNRAQKNGRATAEPDRYADMRLKSGGFPNAKLLRARLLTDGGYFKEAKDMLASVVPADLPTLSDRTEYYYRKGRLADKMRETAAAKLLYQQTIDLAQDNPWYFAPNAALQLGYFAREARDYAAARRYFELALSYKKHEYKSSIDIKARSALGQLPSDQ